MHLDIPSELDLTNLQDRLVLRKAVGVQPALLSLIDRYLDQYLRMFKEPHWRRLSWGQVHVPLGGRRSRGFGLDEMLEITRSLECLSRFPGFAKLLVGFSNPTQILATIFEVQVASWCADRAVTIALEFSPEVLVKDGLKYPDFLWRTDLGSLYCECKMAAEFENKFTRRLHRLCASLDAAYKDHAPWDESLRLHVSIKGFAKKGIERRLRSVVAQASAALRASGFVDKVFQDGEVIASLRARDMSYFTSHGQSDEGEEVGGVSSVVVTDVPTGLGDAYLNLEMSAVEHRAAAAASLLRRARRQLPTDRPGAVFIQLFYGKAAYTKVQALLRNRAYRNTPWVGIWTGDKLWAVWQKGQPFDDRLLVAKRKQEVGLSSSL